MKQQLTRSILAGVLGTQLDGVSSSVRERLKAAEISREVRAEVSGAEPAPFSEKAFLRLQEVAEDAINSLIREAVAASRRQRMDSVSAAHVDYAAGRLMPTTPRRKLLRHLGTLGGILLGAGISKIVSMVDSQDLTFESVLLTSGFLVIGAFLMAIQIAKE